MLEEWKNFDSNNKLDYEFPKETGFMCDPSLGWNTCRLI